MKKLVYINSILRDESRTKILADYAIDKLKDQYEILEIKLNDLDLKPLNKEMVLYRNTHGEEDERLLFYSNAIKDADKIIIASPFYDMGIPAILKTFLERVSLYGITFKGTPTGDCIGNCKASKLLFLTTRGMDVLDHSELDSAYHYLNALSHLWGIKEVVEVSASKLDFLSTDVEKEIKAALKKLDVVLKDF